MEVKAIARISGATGDREPGDKFEVDDSLGESLIDRKLVVRVEPSGKVSGGKSPALGKPEQ